MSADNAEKDIYNARLMLFLAFVQTLILSTAASASTKCEDLFLTIATAESVRSLSLTERQQWFRSEMDKLNVELRVTLPNGILEFDPRGWVFRIKNSTNPGDRIYIEIRLDQQPDVFDGLRKWAKYHVLARTGHENDRRFQEPLLEIEMVLVQSANSGLIREGIDSAKEDALRGRGLATILHRAVVTYANAMGVDNIGAKFDMSNFREFKDQIKRHGDVANAIRSTPSGKILSRLGFEFVPEMSVVDPTVDLQDVIEGRGSLPRVIFRRTSTNAIPLK